MPESLFKSPKNLVEDWPEIFEDLYMNTMPVNYLEYVQLEFSTGMVWEVDVREQLKNYDAETVARKLYETFQEYETDVTRFDFKLDIRRLKRDLKRSTKLIL